MGKVLAPSIGKGSTLFIGNIPLEYNEGGLQSLFKEFGLIKSVQISRHPNGKSKGMGSILFHSRESAKKAISSRSGYKPHPKDNALVVRFKGEASSNSHKSKAAKGSKSKKEGKEKQKKGKRKRISKAIGRYEKNVRRKND